MKNHAEGLEGGMESEIDLSRVEFLYWSDEEIDSFFEERIRGLEDPAGFIQENQWKFDSFKRHYEGKEYSGEELIELFIRNQKRMYIDAKAKVGAVKADIESKQELILEAVRAQLVTYLPDWQPKGIKITLKVMDRANYCHPNYGEVEADLLRLSQKKNPVEDIIQGITHELFHEWNSEQGVLNGRVNARDITSLETGIKLARAKTVDEGLAVLISGQSLKTFYEKSRGDDYEASIDASFRFFEDCLNMKDLGAMKQAYREGLSNMGPFYAVGYEMAHAVLEHVGIERFREVVAGVRENPESLFDEYEAAKI